MHSHKEDRSEIADARKLFILPILLPSFLRRKEFSKFFENIFYLATLGLSWSTWDLVP